MVRGRGAHLGYVLWDAYYVGRMDVVIADMITIGLMGLISDRLILLVEHYALSWRLPVANG